MGLVINTVECSYGPDFVRCSYTTFNAFRRQLCETLQIQSIDGIEAQREICEDAEGDAALLAPLLAHSDCDGILNYDECEQCYPALERCLEHWEGSALKDYGTELVALMKWAAASPKRHLAFC